MYAFIIPLNEGIYLELTVLCYIIEWHGRCFVLGCEKVKERRKKKTQTPTRALSKLLLSLCWIKNKYIFGDYAWGVVCVCVCARE